MKPHKVHSKAAGTFRLQTSGMQQDWMFLTPMISTRAANNCRRDHASSKAVHCMSAHLFAGSSGGALVHLADDQAMTAATQQTSCMYCPPFHRCTGCIHYLTGNDKGKACCMVFSRAPSSEIGYWQISLTRQAVSRFQMLRLL